MSLVVHVRTGDTYDPGEHTFTLYEGSGSSKVAVDLTGCTVLWKTVHKVTATAESSSASVISPATAGKVSPVYSAAASALLELGDHRAEIEVTYPDSSVRTFPTPDQAEIVMRVTRGL